PSRCQAHGPLFRVGWAIRHLRRSVRRGLAAWHLRSRSGCDDTAVRVRVHRKCVHRAGGSVRRCREHRRDVAAHAFASRVGVERWGAGSRPARTIQRGPDDSRPDRAADVARPGSHRRRPLLHREPLDLVPGRRHRCLARRAWASNGPAPAGERAVGGCGAHRLMTRTIGIDFDNTIVSYDELLCRTALDRGLIGEGDRTKRAVRDRVRQLPDGEIEWQKLQALVYGPLMRQALVIEGAEEFIRCCREAGLTVVIVSHKTEYANYDDTRTNLRIAAIDWMEAQGFF